MTEQIWILCDNIHFNDCECQFLNQKKNFFFLFNSRHLIVFEVHHYQLVIAQHVSLQWSHTPIIFLASAKLNSSLVFFFRLIFFPSIFVVVVQIEIEYYFNCKRLKFIIRSAPKWVIIMADMTMRDGDDGMAFILCHSSFIRMGFIWLPCKWLRRFAIILICDVWYRMWLHCWMCVHL